MFMISFNIGQLAYFSS